MKHNEYCAVKAEIKLQLKISGFRKTRKRGDNHDNGKVANKVVLIK